MHYNVTHLRRQAFYALPEDHLALLTAPPFSYLDTLIAVDDAIDANASIAKAILSSALSSFNLPVEFPKPSRSSSGGAPLENRQKHPLDWRGTATANDMDKAQTIIRQLYRDWSAEGAVEREASNGLVLRDLDTYFPPGLDRNGIKILIPGAGLGRLMFDICRAGFEAAGNEISYHALFASYYILNAIPAGKQYNLYPWATHFSNRVSRKDQLRCVEIPDVHPETALNAASVNQRIHAFARMSMSASDFTVLYSDADHRDKYDAVCTVFFIDTAPNVLRYIETIRNCLKPGGLWINVGPLLWHFSPSNPNPRSPGSSGYSGSNNAPAGSSEASSFGGGQKEKEKETKKRSLGIAEPGSVELTNEEVLLLLERSGFSIELQEIVSDDPSSLPSSSSTTLTTPSSSADVPASEKEEPRTRRRTAGYIHDRTSLFQQTFRVAHWVARKKGA